MMEIDDQFLRINEVVKKTGRSRASIYRMIEAGTFPRQISIGMRSVGWRLSAVISWMSNPTDYRAD